MPFWDQFEEVDEQSKKDLSEKLSAGVEAQMGVLDKVFSVLNNPAAGAASELGQQELEQERALAQVPQVKLDPYSQLELESSRAGRGRPETGKEPGTEFTTALATIPANIAGTAITTANRLMYGKPMEIPDELKDDPTASELYTVFEGIRRQELSEGKASPETFGEWGLQHPRWMNPDEPIKTLLAKNPKDKPVVAATRDIFRMIMQLQQFSASPLGIASAGVSAAYKPAAPLVRWAFGLDIVKNIAAQVPDVLKNWKNLTPAQKTDVIVEFGGNALLAGLLTHPELKTKISEMEPVSRLAPAPAQPVMLPPPMARTAPAPISAQLPPGVAPMPITGTGAELMPARTPVQPGQIPPPPPAPSEPEAAQRLWEYSDKQIEEEMQTLINRINIADQRGINPDPQWDTDLAELSKEKDRRQRMAKAFEPVSIEDATNLPKNAPEELHNKVAEAFRKTFQSLKNEGWKFDPEWGPLELILKPEWLDGFMFMGKHPHPTIPGRFLYEYKHGITRRYLRLDDEGQAYGFKGNAPTEAEMYPPMDLNEAIERVYDRLGPGENRETKYNREFIEKRNAELLKAGFGVARGTREGTLTTVPKPKAAAGAPTIPEAAPLPAAGEIPKAPEIPGAASVVPTDVTVPPAAEVAPPRTLPAEPKLPAPMRVEPAQLERVKYTPEMGRPLPETSKTLNLPKEFDHLKPMFEVVKDGWDMPQAIVRDAIQRRGTPELIDAVWHGDKLYLNASRLQDPAVLNEKLIHEVAIHYGLPRALGAERMRSLSDNIWNTLDINQKQEIIRRNGLDAADKASIGEEWLAYEAERVSRLGKVDTIWNRVATAVAKFMRTLGLPFRYTNLEIARLIHQGKKAVSIPVDTEAEGGIVSPASSPVELREAKAKHVTRFDDAITVSTTKEGQIVELGSRETGSQVILPNKYSMVDYEKIWRPTALNQLLKNGVSRPVAERWLRDMDQLTSMAVTEADKAGLLDRIPSEKRPATGMAPDKGVVRGNEDYIISWDASGICTLRVPATDYLNALVDELGRRGKNAGMNEVEREMVLTMLARKGMPRPCVICYVETRRALRQKLADEYSRWLTDEPIREEQKEGMADPNDAMKSAKAYAKANNLKYQDIDQSVFLDDREFRKSFKDPNSHVSKHPRFYRSLNKQITANASKVFGMASYKGQYRFIPKNVLNWSQMSGGLRFYSISDFMFEHAVDLMQTIADIAGKSRAHIYTKQPATVDMLKNTGMKINLSLVPKIDAAGNIVEWTNQSFPWELAKDLSAKNPDIGITMLATNDKVLAWALQQPWIHYVLPYHRSGMYEPMFRELQTQQGWHDYEKANGRNKGKEQRLYVEDDAKWAKFEAEYKKRFPRVDHKPTWKIGWFLDGKAMSDVDIVKRALADADKYGFALPFDRWMRNPDGTPNPNAAKLLKDYGRTDTPQRMVQPVFDHSAFSNLLNAWVKNKGYATKISPKLVSEMADELGRYRQWTEEWGLPANAWNRMSPDTEAQTWNQLIRTGLRAAEMPEESLAEYAGRAEALPGLAPRKFSFAEGEAKRSPAEYSQEEWELLMEDLRDEADQFARGGAAREGGRRPYELYDVIDQFDAYSRKNPDLSIADSFREFRKSSDASDSRIRQLRILLYDKGLLEPKFSMGQADREAEIRAAARTAIGRPEAAEPTQWLMRKATLSERRNWDSGFGKGKTVLHFGSGEDKASTEMLGSEGATVTEYDPTYAPDRSVLNHPYDRVVSNFVLNVLPPELRAEALEDLQMTVGRDGLGYISVRSKGDTSIKGTPEFDGVRTSRGTFQKGYTVDEFRNELNKYFHDVQILRGTDKTKSIIAQVQRPTTHWRNQFTPIVPSKFSMEQVFRGTPKPEDRPKLRDFGAVFAAEDIQSARQYGEHVTKYQIEPGRMLDSQSPEARKLAEEFSGNKFEGADWEDAFPEFFMFPTKEFARFLTDQGYQGFKTGKDIAIFDPSKLESMARVLSTPEDVFKFVQERKQQGRPTFLRVSNSDLDLSVRNFKSRIQKRIPDATHERGMSTLPLWSNDHFVKMTTEKNMGEPEHIAGQFSNFTHLIKDDPKVHAWLVTGRINGFGYDGEPLLRNARKIADVSNAAAADLTESWAKKNLDPETLAKAQKTIDAVRATPDRKMKYSMGEDGGREDLEPPPENTAEGILWRAVDDRAHGDEATAEAGHQVWRELEEKGFNLQQKLKDDEIKALEAEIEKRAKPIRDELYGPDLKYAMGRGGPAPYSPIQQLIDQIKAKAPVGVKERVSARQKVVDAWAKGKEIGLKVLGGMTSVGESIKDSYRGVRRPEDIEQSLGTLDWLLQQSSAMSKRAKIAIPQQFKNKAMRDAIGIWIDAGGNEQSIRYTISVLPPDTKPEIRKALDIAADLPPEAVDFAQGVMQFFGLKAQDAIAHDIFKEALDDYYTHIWKNEQNMPSSLRTAIGSGKVNSYFQYGRHRTIPSILEGIEQGKEPILDPADVLPFYNYLLDRAIASRQFVRAVSDLTAADGRPALAVTGTAIPTTRGGVASGMLIIPRAKGEELKGYRPIEHPAMRGWKWATQDQNGNPVFYQGDLQAHPEFYERIARIMDRSRLTPSPWMSRALRLSQEFKAAKLSAIPSGFHQVHVGTHALWHWTNPLPALFSRNAIDWDAPATQFAVEKGHLKLAPNPAELSDFAEVIGGQGLVNKIPWIGPVSKAYSEWLFGEYIPRLKLRTFQNALDRNMQWYAKDIARGKITPDEIAARVGDSVNNAYGELNQMFLNKFGRDPRNQRLLRAMFLAPDFGEARLRFVGKAVSRYGMEERLAMATMFTTLYVSARIANWATHGNPETDKKHMFSVKIGDEWYSMRSVIGDLLHLWTDFGNFMYVRLNPLYSRTLADIMLRRDVTSGRKLSAFERFVTRPLQQLIPIQFSNLTRDDQNIWESFISAAGLQMRHEKARYDVRQMLNQWMEKNPDPKIQSDYQAAEEQVPPKSRYERFRAALHDGNIKRAQKEWNTLRQTHTIKQIDQALTPWTKTRQGARKKKTLFLSEDYEKQFVDSLDPAQRKVYDQAIADRDDIWASYLVFKNTAR